MFNVIYTEKVRNGSEVIERRNTVSVSQDYLERSGLVNYCEVASTDATKDGFCVYVSENPQSSVKKYTCNRKHQIMSKKCGSRSDDEKLYNKTLTCMHYLAKAINKAYIDGKDYFNVDEWLLENHYA